MKILRGMNKMAKFTKEYLKELQSYPLDTKISLTKARIREWVNAYSEEGVYISFSGGKDSTVLLDIARKLYPNIEAVFVDVPTQYPELKQFATSFENVTVLRPKISFAQVCEKYGFPFISKEVAESVEGARKFLKIAYDRQTDRQIPYAYWYADLVGIPRRGKDKENNEFLNLKKGILDTEKYRYGVPVRLAAMFGEVPHKEKGELTGEKSQMYDRSKYKFFLNAPFEISSKCCNAMKKAPLKKYQKETGKNPITAQMASESRLRTQKWLQNGCNAFESRHKISNPMSFWTEQDVLQYIKRNNLPICSVYGEIVEEPDEDGVNGQLSFSDIEEWKDIDFSEIVTKLKTTGCNRTGCMLCGFGCHLEKSPNRFEMLRETHPNMYKLLDLVKNNGYTMRQAIDWINENGNMNIRY